MKDFIVIVALLVLGVFIFGLILGDDGSLKDASKGLMQAQVENIGD